MRNIESREDYAAWDQKRKAAANEYIKKMDEVYQQWFQADRNIYNFAGFSAVSDD